MCDTQTLAASAEGYIIRCAECGRMQICFGIAAIILKQDQFYRLKVHVAEAILYGGGYGVEPDRRAISLPVNKTVILCLSWNELKALEELVTQAAALMEVYDLLAQVR
ncbi:MAG: DUF6686 family protein [Taibaiella sp.]|jgi:hypothetical protein